METPAGSTNNLRRTDSNLSMMTDDSSSELASTAHAHHHVGHHQADPPAIATNGTGMGALNLLQAYSLTVKPVTVTQYEAI